MSIINGVLAKILEKKMLKTKKYIYMDNHTNNKISSVKTIIYLELKLLKFDKKNRI